MIFLAWSAIAAALKEAPGVARTDPLAWVLGPANYSDVVARTGPEKGPWIRDQVQMTIFADYLGYRFVLLTPSGEPVSGLQVVRHGGVWLATTAYTVPAARRQGAASALVRAAEALLPGKGGIVFSDDRIPEGKAWIAALQAPPAPPSSAPPWRIVSVSEDSEDEEAGWELEEIFLRSGINIARYEEPLYAVVTEDGEVLGGLVAGFTGDEVEMEWRFSIVVDEDARRQGIARALVQALVEDYQQQRGDLEEAHGAPVILRAWVINPDMADLLESEGFEPDGTWSLDNPFMSYSG